MVERKDYETHDARVLFVDEDWVVPGTFRVFWKTASGALFRVQSKYLPERSSRDLAQLDLNEYARIMRYTEL